MGHRSALAVAVTVDGVQWTSAARPHDLFNQLSDFLPGALSAVDEFTSPPLLVMQTLQHLHESLGSPGGLSAN